MHKFLLTLTTFCCLYSFATAQCNNDGVIVNEFSNGESGNKEYVELLVVGCPGSFIDLENYRVDDNNGEFSGGASSGEGIASGHICLADNQWSNIAVGSIIVIYNDADKNISFGNGAGQISDDPTDANNDLVYVLPISSSLLGGSGSLPSQTNDTYGTCNASSQTWTTIGLRNGGDAMQTRTNDGSFFHGISYGASGIVSSNDGLHFPGNGADRVYLFENTIDDNFRDIANFTWRDATNSTATTNESPGRANTTENQAFIDYLKSAQTETITITEGTKTCSSVELVADDYCAYQWSKLPSSTVIGTGKTFTATSAGTYSLSVTTDLGCTYTETHDVTLSSANVSLSTPGILCDNASFTASITGPDAAGSSVSWSSPGNVTNDNGLNEDYFFSTNGTINATVTTSAGCVVNLSVTINPNSNNATLNLNPDPICLGETVVASVNNVATGSQSISFSNWTIESGGENLSNDGGSSESFKISNTPAKISVVVSDGNGCEATVEATPNLKPTPSAPTTSDIELCLNEGVTPISPEGSDFVWLAGDSSFIGNTAPTYTTNSVLDTTFYVYETDNGCISDTAALNVTVNNLPQAILQTKPSQLCTGDSVLAYILNKQDVQSAVWSNSNLEYTIGTDSAMYFFPTSGNYSIDITLSSANGCGNVLSETVTLHPNASQPNVSSFNICSNEAVPDFSNGGTYYYQNEDKSLTFSTKPDFTGYTVLDTILYAFEFDAANGCHSDTVPIHLVIKPKASVPNAADWVYCQYQTPSQLTPNTNQYIWFNLNGDTLNEAPTPNTAEIGENKYVVKDSTHQCYSEPDTATVTVLAKPNAIAVDTLRYCAGATASPLTPSGTTYYWRSAASNFGNTAPTPNTNTIGLEIFTVYEEVNGCRSDETEIVVITKNQPSYQHDSDYFFCSENRLVDLEPRADTVQWFDNNNLPIPAPTIDLNFAQQQQFTFRIEQDGCFSPTSEVTVRVENQPATPADVNHVFCTENRSFNLSPTQDNFKWFDANSNALPEAPSIDLNIASTYTFKLVDTNYFCSSDSAQYNIKVKQTGNTPPGSNTSYCQSDITFPASVGGSNIEWFDVDKNPISSAPIVDLNTPGNFTYFFSDTLNQCAADTNTYSYLINPRPATPKDTILNQCEGDQPILLTPAGPGYLWYIGTDTYDSLYTEPNTMGSANYQYTLTDDKGCESLKANVEVRIGQKSSIPTIASPQEFCLNSSGKLSPESNDIIWYSDVDNNVYSILSPSTNTQNANDSVFYAASIASGCPSDIVQVTARVLPKPTLPTFGNIMLCVGDNPYTPNYSGTDLTWHQNTTSSTGQNTPYTSSTSSADSLVYHYYKIENTCSSDTITYSVKINDNPSTPSAIINSVCDGDPILLTQENAPHVLNYTFNNGDFFEPTADTNITALADYTDYTIQIRHALTGCTNSLSGTIEIKQVTPITLPQRDVCLKSATDFTAATSSYDAVTWETPTGIVLSGAYNVTSISKADSGKHYYTVFTNGCPYSDSVLVSVLDTPTVAFNAVPFLCPDSSTAISMASKTADGLLSFDYIYNGAAFVGQPENNPLITIGYGDNLRITAIEDDNCRSDVNIGLNSNNHPWPAVHLNNTRYEICNDSVMVPLVFEGTPNYTGSVNSSDGNFLFSATTDTNLYFSQPNTYEILSISDNTCSRDTSIQFEIVSPLSQEPKFIFSDSILCFGSDLEFRINNTDPDADYEYSLDGSNFELYNAPIRYVPQAGACYGLNVRVSKASCNVQYAIDTAFCALQEVVADFVTYDIIEENAQIVDYFNQSLNYDSLYWFSNLGQNASNAEQVYFDFPLGIDTLNICLEASAQNTCFDTICTEIIRSVETKIYVPSAFTPNGDGHNEGFKPEIFGEVLRYRFEIFNRWGEKIYETEDSTATWDGVFNGQIVPNGVYAWKLRYFNYSVYNQEMHGTVTIIR